MNPSVDPSIFKAYDIRGIVGKTLTADTARLIGVALANRAREQGMTELAIGRDGRLSGPELATALADGVRDGGLDVADIGMVTTPILYFATYHLGCGTGVAITGSHNPPEYNGLKMVIAGDTLHGPAIQEWVAKTVTDWTARGIIKSEP